MWIITPAGDIGEETLFDQETLQIPLPAHLGDVSSLSSPHQLKQLLSMREPGLPPETLARMSDPIWKTTHDILPEDVILVPLYESREFAAAFVNAPLAAHEKDFGEWEYRLPVRWADGILPMSLLKPYYLVPEKSGPWLLAVDDAEARRTIRQALDLPGQRFGSLRWIASGFSLLTLFYFVVGMFRS